MAKIWLRTLAGTWAPKGFAFGFNGIAGVPNSTKVVWYRQQFWNGIDFELRWVRIVVTAVADQTPAAPVMDQRTNYRTGVTWTNPSGNVGGWERTTWVPELSIVRASDLTDMPGSPFQYSIGVTSDLKTWSSTYDGTDIRARLRWVTDAGPGPWSAYSNIVTISGGFG